jgi:hypothetical protein
MNATISTKSKNISLDFIKTTAGYISGATGEYISEAMPVSKSTISGAKQGLQELNTTLSSTSSSILPKISQIKNQGVFKSISNWFMQKEESYDSSAADNDSSLDFDVPVDDESSKVTESQISEWGANANQISKTIIESSHKMLEAQVSATANLVTAADKQIAVMSSGFDNVNNTLNSILKVLTKNTAALIETTVASSNSRHGSDGLAAGKFDFSNYKKMVMGNIKQSELGVGAAFLSMALGMGGMVKPQELIQYGIATGINKLAPNLKKNLGALDSAVNDVIMDSLIRLGENKNNHSIGGKLAQLFGIDSKRDNLSTQRSSLELKNVGFNSIANESIVGAIPGYLRHILMAVGGPDLTYDFRSRSFKSKGQIARDFRSQAISDTKGSLYDAGDHIRGRLGDSKFSHMVYDLMMNELGTRASNGGARKTISNFGNSKETQDYSPNSPRRNFIIKWRN